MQDHEILPNKVGGPGGQQCKKDVCGQRIVLVLRVANTTLHSARFKKILEYISGSTTLVQSVQCI